MEACDLRHMKDLDEEIVRLKWILAESRLAHETTK